MIGSTPPFVADMTAWVALIGATAALLVSVARTLGRKLDATIGGRIDALERKIMRALDAASSATDALRSEEALARVRIFARLDVLDHRVDDLTFAVDRLEQKK